MISGKTRTQILTASLSLILLSVFWITLAPTQLGGQVTYVIVDGISMEPGFHRGDLALIRARPDYGVGDAVVYQDPIMGGYVFHRIVGMELDRFVLQGDNNSWLDTYHPVPDEIVGKLWVRIPKFGKAIEWMRVPINMSLAVGLMGVVLMSDMFKTPARDRNKKGMPLVQPGQLTQGALYAAGFAALLFLAIGIIAFTRPLNRPAENIPYLQEGNYYYSATGTPGVYDTDVVQSGEPVFPKLTCFLNIGYTYNIVGERLLGIQGSHKMYARIMDKLSGWQRTIPLSTNAVFTGNSYFVTTALDLCQVESIVNLVEAEAGLKQIAYTLEIVSDAAFTASVDGNPISDSLSSALVFNYDKVHFYLDEVTAGTDPLRSSKQGLVGNANSEPNFIPLFGAQIPVWLVRLCAALGFGFSSLALIAAGWVLYNKAGQSEEARIRIKYGGMLVQVHEQNLAPAASVIDVTAMDDLARLAERHGTMILHTNQNSFPYYFVQNNGITYRYVSDSNRNRIPDNQLVSGEITNQTKQVKMQPAPAPAPIHRDTASQTASSQQSKPVPVQTGATQPQRANPVHQPIGEYIIDFEAIQRARITPDTKVEYVIQTGILEVAMPVQESKVLGKIKLPVCDPRSAS